MKNRISTVKPVKHKRNETFLMSISNFYIYHDSKSRLKLNTFNILKEKKKVSIKMNLQVAA